MNYLCVGSETRTVPLTTDVFKTQDPKINKGYATLMKL